jgi:uncharacterized integral membrane protein
VKHLSWIVTIPVTLVVVVFALANRHEVRLSFWPFPWATDLPVYVIVLCCLLVGFLLGAGLAWLSGGPRRRRARQTAERARALADQLAELKRRQAAANQAPTNQAAALEHRPGA